MNARDWFNNLQSRERLLLIGGVVALAILIIYLWVLEPLSRDVRDLRARSDGAEAQLSWMRNASAEVRSLKSSGSRNTKVDTRTSLITAVEKSTTQAAIRGSVKRMEPRGNNKISVELEGVGFDQLMSWLGTLESRYGAKAVQVNSTRSNLPGRVDARLILERSS